MSKMNYVIGSSGEITSPVLHDYELISVDMNFGLIEVVISDFHRKSKIVISCHRPSWIKLESDHLQNVIRSVHILRDISELILSFLPNEIRLEFLNAVPDHPRLLLLITPITGVDAKVVCEEISINEVNGDK